MKKIKTKITNIYNRYLVLMSKNIKIKITNIYNRYLALISKNIKIKKNAIDRYLFTTFKSITTTFKKTLLFIIRLKFIKSSKVDISVFNRYLITLIVILFSYLFYLSIPELYNYEKLQKDLTKKLLKEFNLNAALSADITYKILPRPNFEISNVILSTDSEEKFDDFVQIKKMKIYVYITKLHNQEKLDIKQIVFSQANININKDSFNYLSNFLKKKISNKKIKITKSKIFFKEKNENKNTFALSSVNHAKISYHQENNNNKLNIKGTIFNTKYNLNIDRSIEKLYQTNFNLRFSQLNTNIKNILTKNVNNDDYIGKVYITFAGSEININYEIKDKIIFFNSFQSTLNKKKINFNGEINSSPFNFDIHIDLEKINIPKLVKNLSKIKNLFNSKIFFHDNFNGKILVNIDTLSKIKLFDQAKINLKFVNGKLIIDDTVLISNKIGELQFIDSKLFEINEEQIFKTKILFKIIDQKKFYQLFQVPKNNRKKLHNVYVEIEKNLNVDGIEVNKFVINSKTKTNSPNKSFDLTKKIDFSEIYNLKNWIEVKKFSNQLFSKIN